jgi:Fe-S cluster assembly iron-binding protein IscA
MIQVTERAQGGLREILSASRAPSDQGVKLIPADTGGIGMTIGSASEGDVVFDGGRKPLLIVDSAIVRHLDGAVIDLTRGDGEEAQFVIRRDDVADPS